MKERSLPSSRLPGAAAGDDRRELDAGRGDGAPLALPWVAAGCARGYASPAGCPVGCTAYAEVICGSPREWEYVMEKQVCGYSRVCARTVARDLNCSAADKRVTNGFDVHSY